MKVNFGCGKHKLDGFIGVDKLKTESVDIIHDMNLFPYPFRDNSVDEVFLSHILEHLPNTIRVLEEIYRICKNGAIIRIIVPYYNSPGAFHDPTHIKYFTEHSLDYFTEKGETCYSEYNYYSKARFQMESIIPGQRKILSMLPERIQWFLGHHFSTIHSLEFRVKVRK